MPYARNPYFTGRAEVLQELHQALGADATVALAQTQAVSGLGGLGKTQTAVEYAYRYRREYTAVLWALADSSAALFSGFTALAQVLNLPEQDAQEQQLAVNAVTRWLRQERGWLLILDNADEPQIVKEFLPPDHQGRLLLTSRARVFDALGVRRPLSLEKMSAAEAQEFLLNRSGILAAKPNAAQFPSWEGQGVGQLLNQEERAALQQLAQELDGLPLALEQAGAYILRQQCTFSRYLASYRKRRLSLLEQAQPLN